MRSTKLWSKKFSSKCGVVFQRETYLILLDEALALLVNVDSAMLSVVDFIVTNNRIGIRADLNACQSVAVNIVVLNKAATFSKNVHSALMSIVDVVPAYRWITVRCYPDASEVVRVDFIHEELSSSIFMDINTTGLPMVDLTSVNYLQIL